jgi:hypothetical protein
MTIPCLARGENVGQGCEFVNQPHSTRGCNDGKLAVDPTQRLSSTLERRSICDKEDDTVAVARRPSGELIEVARFEMGEVRGVVVTRYVHLGTCASWRSATRCV